MINGIEYTVKGLNRARLLSDLAKKNVVISRVKNRSDAISFVVAKSDSLKVVDYMQKKCYNVITWRTVGWTSFFDTIRKNLIIAIAVCVAIICVAVGSNFCFSIKIDSTAERDDVIAALDEYGVKIGSCLNAISLDGLENYLVSAIDGISYAIVDISGSTVSVKLIDSLPYKPVNDFSKAVDLKATRAGVVTRIVCIMGTPLVAVGDTVSVGQTLIKGEKTYRDGTTEPVTAVGEVFATVTSVATAVYTPLVVEYERTGREQTLVSFELFGRKVDSIKSPIFEKYESETEYFTFSPTGIVAIVTTLYELESRVNEYSFDERYPILARQAEETARKAADYDVIDVITTQTGNIITVTVVGEMLVSAAK